MSERKRYPSDLSDERWALIEPVISAWKAAHRSVSGHQGGYVLPDHPAYQQILTAFGDLRRPLRARDLCLALDLPVTAKATENIRSKLKRLVSRGIFTEIEPGLFAQPRP